MKGIIERACPRCGSPNTRIDRWTTDNLRLGVLYLVLALFGVPPKVKLKRVCLNCGGKSKP
jgi:ribosomal protein S27AE